MRIELVMKDGLRTPEVDAWLKDCEDKLNVHANAMERAMYRYMKHLLIHGSISDDRKADILEEELGR